MRHILAVQPELAVFLALAGGYLLGRVRFAGLTLGPTVGTLVVAVAIGQLHVAIAPVVKSLVFALFLFVMGYTVGPQFFSGLKRDALQEIGLTLVLCATALLTVLAIAWSTGLDGGAAAGLAAGGLTQSAAVGTASEAIQRLGRSPAEVETLQSNLAIGYAITYLFGELGLLVFVRNISPMLLGIDLRRAAAAYAARLSRGEPSSGAGEAFGVTVQGLRSYRTEIGRGAGRSVAEIEAAIGQRVAVERILRAGRTIEVTPDTVIEAGDIIAVAGRQEALIESAAGAIGCEVECREAKNIASETLDVVMTDKAFDGKPLAAYAEHIGAARTHGVFVQRILRQGLDIPVEAGTIIGRGDVFRITGAVSDVERIAALTGYVDRPSDRTDLVFVGLGIVVGTLIGLLDVDLGGVRLTLGVGGGILVSGIGLGWLRARYPVFGRLPGPAQWVFVNFGLNAFIAVIGLSIGPTALDAIVRNGPSLLLSGIVVTLLPPAIALYFGKLVLGMEPVILIGALAGARSNTAVITAVTEAAGNATPVLGFTLPYAVSNVLLTVMGSVIVGLV